MSYEDIWRALSNQWSADVALIDRAPYDAVGQAQLYQCDGCALAYFSPLLPGSADFYATVSANPTYYVNDRWEFREVVSSLVPGESVMDFGGGRGAFLAAARSRGGRVIGCDHNTAVHLDSDTDMVIAHRGFADFAEQHSGTFDVATSFHVLEHVAAAREICQPARTVLRPGGRFFISTPDAMRTVRDDFEVLDCPPHHLSRWTETQFAQLGDLHGFELISIRHEPFVHRFGLRRAVPLPLLYGVALLRHRLRGRGIRSRGQLKVGLADSHWPRGLAILAEYRRP